MDWLFDCNAILQNPASQASSRRHSGQVIAVKTALVNLPQNIYQDIRDQNLEKDKNEDENFAEAHARAQMAPMLTTTNQFLGSVQQMMAALKRCIEEAMAALA